MKIRSYRSKLPVVLEVEEASVLLDVVIDIVIYKLYKNKKKVYIYIKTYISG